MRMTANLRLLFTDEDKFSFDILITLESQSSNALQALAQFYSAIGKLRLHYAFVWELPFVGWAILKSSTYLKKALLPTLPATTW